MSAYDLVDAALAGFLNGELVTIPSLHNDTYWQAMENHRQAIIPHLYSNVPADRYRVGLTH